MRKKITKHDSPDYGEFFTIELSHSERKQLLLKVNAVGQVEQKTDADLESLLALQLETLRNVVCDSVGVLVYSAVSELENEPCGFIDSVWNYLLGVEKKAS